MNDKWVPVSDGVPSVKQGRNVVTANVYVRFSDGTIGIGYFNHRDGLWYSEESKKYKANEVTAWKGM